MAENPDAAGLERMFGEFAPLFVELSDRVLFGQVWKRAVLSPKERSLVTVASLITSGSVEQLVFHLRKAQDNGASKEELIEVITHLAFYASWPKARSALVVAKEVLEGRGI